VGMMVQETTEIIDFLKQYHNNYQGEIINLIDSSLNGLYLINDSQISFSTQAKTILNIEEEISLLDFYDKINLQDRENVKQKIEQSRNDQTIYEVIYRYKIDQEQMIWIKEHGIFSFKHNNQRLAMIADYTKQLEQDKELFRLAYYDKITHLKNRNYFEKDIDFLIKYQVPFALFLLDLNHFRIINDNLGHTLGDEVLNQFSIQLKACLSLTNEADIYRLSGDDFAIILPYIKTKIKALKIVNQIIEEFKQLYKGILYIEIIFLIILKSTLLSFLYLCLICPKVRYIEFFIVMAFDIISTGLYLTNASAKISSIASSLI